MMNVLYDDYCNSAQYAKCRCAMCRFTDCRGAAATPLGLTSAKVSLQTKSDSEEEKKFETLWRNTDDQK
jgi:hypothetical protein